jgi:hypothetical protein
MWSYRRRLGAEAEARAAWLDAAALLEARSRADFKSVQDAHESLVGTLTDMRTDMARRDDHLNGTLAQLGMVCETLAERMEADREERREFMRTINALASALVSRSDAPASHVVGGSVYGTPQPHNDELTRTGTPGAATTIDLTAVEVNATERTNNGTARATPVNNNGFGDGPAPGAEVRCRFGDRWVDGFEVLEVHSREGRARYRVRRRSDGSVVRKLFEAADLEPVTRRVGAVSDS